MVNLRIILGWGVGGVTSIMTQNEEKSKIFKEGAGVGAGGGTRPVFQTWNLGQTDP